MLTGICTVAWAMQDLIGLYMPQATGQSFMFSPALLYTNRHSPTYDTNLPNYEGNKEIWLNINFR